MLAHAALARLSLGPSLQREHHRCQRAYKANRGFKRLLCQEHTPGISSRRCASSSARATAQRLLFYAEGSVDLHDPP